MKELIATIIVILVGCVSQPTKNNTKLAYRVAQKDTCADFFAYFKANWRYDSAINRYVVLDTFETRIREVDNKPQKPAFSIFENKISSSKCWIGLTKDSARKILGKNYTEDNFAYRYYYKHTNDKTAKYLFGTIFLYKKSDTIKRISMILGNSGGGKHISIE